MPYLQEISREQPGVFLFLIDQSKSMEEPFAHNNAGEPISRAAVVAEALNNTLEELVNRCVRDEGVRDYFHVGVIGYGKFNRAAFSWEGEMAKRSIVSISRVARNATVEEQEIETTVRGQTVRERATVYRWVTPQAVGSTPMNSAFQLAHQAMEQWVYRHPQSYPPIVINITDGMANDVESKEELLASARRLTDLKTTDGNVLLINCHISGGENEPVVFPWSPLDLPKDSYARLLFEMSSEISERLRDVICEIFGRDASQIPMLKGMAYNADAVALVKVLDIGTRQAIVLPSDAGFDSLTTNDAPVEIEPAPEEEKPTEGPESFS